MLDVRKPAGWLFLHKALNVLKLVLANFGKFCFSNEYDFSLLHKARSTVFTLQQNVFSFYVLR